LEDHCLRVARFHCTNSWVPTDLDPANVIVEGGAVRFIDLDGSVLAPAPLSAAVLARRFERHGIVNTMPLYSAYEQGWMPPLEVCGRRGEFEVVSILLEAYLAWERVILKTRQGEIFDLRDPLRALLARRTAAQLQVAGAGSPHRR
jgi:hypothetical protein